MRSEAAAPVANPYLPAAFQVIGRRRETGDTLTLQLRPPNGDRFPFQPGQFTMIGISGVGEVPISISGSAQRPEVLAQTIRAVGAVTRALTSLDAGDRVDVRGPFGRGWPLEEAKGRDVLVVAGGLGLAPLRPAILHILAHRAAYRRVVVLYGTRTPADQLYRRDLAQWRGRFDLDTLVTVDAADTDWHGNIGVVPALLAQVEKRFDPANTVAMLCGPEIMMHFTRLELEKRGVHDHHIYLSMERNMKCAMGFCGHCQYGPYFICKDGPVFPYHRIALLFETREI
ncbi:MAG: FAD/NAD(P)-binding protein [Chloroflexi bacterium]|nr:FAD/NAD(P)-binding protein [Chloroflexota bacterium]